MAPSDIVLQRQGTDRGVTEAGLGFLQCGKAIGTVVVASGHAGPGIGAVCDYGIGAVSCIVKLGTRDLSGCQNHEKEDQHER